MENFNEKKDNMEKNENARTTLGEKLRSARKNAGLTQEQLAEKLLISRQAVTKCEADRGMPDIENLKRLSYLLGVSIDYLLEGGESLDLSVTREEIDLDCYHYERTFRGRWNRKAGKKDLVVREEYPDAEIHCLTGKQIPAKGEKAVDNAIGFLTTAPFGMPELINGIRNMDREFYLVNQAEQQFFVTVTDEFIESRRLGEKITVREFQKNLLLQYGSFFRG